MIPRILHYCWFGNKEKPVSFTQCLESWKKHCKDYDIIEWNESNSSQFSNLFYKNSLRKKKYAFVSDYVRTKVLYEYGGVYLDTDMLLVKPIEDLLHYSFFSGFEVKARVAYGFFGGNKKNHFFKKMLTFYDENNFNQFSPPVITHIFKNVVNLNNLKQNEVLFNPEYFYPLTFQNKKKDYNLFLKEETYAVHLWDHSWKEDREENLSNLLNKIKIVLIDYLFYGYSKKYLKRYTKEFFRKFFLKLKK